MEGSLIPKRSTNTTFYILGLPDIKGSPLGYRNSQILKGDAPGGSVAFVILVSLLKGTCIGSLYKGSLSKAFWER